MIDFIDDHCDTYGVKPVCKMLPIVPSTYYETKLRQADPVRRPVRQQRNAQICEAIQQTWDATNHCVCGARKVWRRLQRDQWIGARCTVERLMRDTGLRGVTRGRAPRTTRSDPCQTAPEDHVCREVTADAPNRLWVADFTYVATWRGFVYLAFVVDVFARRIVGWRTASASNTSLVLDALEQVIHDRRPATGLIQHTDRGAPYLSIRYSKRWADIGIQPSVGRVGSSYDNVLAETVIGLFKTEVIRRIGPWRHLDAVEFATLGWVDWFNHQRLLGPIGDIPPAEAEASSMTHSSSLPKQHD